MTNISVELRIPKETLEKLTAQALDRAINRAGDSAAIYLEGKVKQTITAFTRTGRLRSSIAWRRSGRWRWSIGTDVDYALPVEEGSKPHEIRPRTKKALRWPTAGRTAAGLGRSAAGTARGRGQFAFAKVVRHPGFRGHHYMRNTFQREAGTVQRIFEAELGRAIG